MRADLRTIVVFLDATPSGERRAAHAAAFAQRWGAHLVGVHVVFAGVRLDPSMSNARGSKAIQHVFAYKQQLDEEAEASGARLGERFRSLCERLGVSGEHRAIARGKSEAEAILHSLHSDLVVVGHPAHGLPDGMSPESLLLSSRMPLLIVPDAWEGDTIGDRVLIGWNATPEARRAVSDSMSFLVAAKSVTVLVVDPARSQHHGDEPGADIALHLARHGVQVEVVQTESGGSPIAEVILGQAARIGADLLVVGAYSHARLKQLLLGGATRTLLTRTPVPVLISR